MRGDARAPHLGLVMWGDTGRCGSESASRPSHQRTGPVRKKPAGAVGGADDDRCSTAAAPPPHLVAECARRSAAPAIAPPPDTAVGSRLAEQRPAGVGSKGTRDQQPRIDGLRGAGLCRKRLGKDAPAQRERRCLIDKERVIAATPRAALAGASSAASQLVASLVAAALPRLVCCERAATTVAQIGWRRHSL